MKKVVFVDSGFSSGGAEHQCVQLMNMLVERGHEVTCVTFMDIPDHYIISDKVRRVHLAPYMSKLRKLIALEMYLLRVKADTVIAFSQRLSVLCLPAMLLRPHVNVVSSDRNFTIGTPSLYEKILVKTRLWRRANHIIPNSFSQGKYLSQNYPELAKKISVITNYTNIELYNYTNPPHNKVIQIGVFCRYEYQKNFHGFINMLRDLKLKSDKEFHVSWYGNHNFENKEQIDYFEKCVEKIRHYDLEDILTVNGPTKDVAKLIPTFDVLCLPSFKEGFSNSISEYICCGRPVLCSDVSDNSMMVHDGRNGFLFNPNDAISICSAFLKIFALTHEELENMSKESRKIAESLFDKNVFINKYESLIV